MILHQMMLVHYQVNVKHLQDIGKIAKETLAAITITKGVLDTETSDGGQMVVLQMKHAVHVTEGAGTTDIG